jgi:hypothetical protein
MADVLINKREKESGLRGQGQWHAKACERGMARGGPASLFSLTLRDLLTVSPSDLMRRFTEGMDQLFEGTSISPMTVWSPSIAISEKDGHIKVCAELPGFVGQSAGAVLEVAQALNESSQGEGPIRRIQRRRLIRFILQNPLLDRDSPTETEKWRMGAPDTIRAKLCADLGGHVMQPRYVERCNSLCPVLALSLAYPAITLAPHSSTHARTTQDFALCPGALHLVL